MTAGVLAFSVSTSASYANDDTAKAIAGIIALGLLGAAVAQDQHDRGHEEYTAHPRLHPDENAVGHCVHRGKHLVKKAGGNRFNLDHVNDISVNGDGSTHVSFVGTGYYVYGHKTSDVICVVKNGKVASLKFKFN